MRTISEYRGNMLNHVEALHKPGERDLAIELAEVLGCSVSDTGIDSRSHGTYLAIHPSVTDPDPVNNAIYVSQVTDEQFAVENALSELAKRDKAFTELFQRHQVTTQRWPFGFPHFGLRYGEEAQIEDVASRAEKASPQLRDRVTVLMFRPGPDSPSEFIQGFVHQDVIVAGSFFFGQLIELQFQPPS